MTFERVQTLLDQLEKVTIHVADRTQTRTRMLRQREAAKTAVKTLATHDPA